MPLEINEVSLYDRGRIVVSGGGGGSGSGLPNEVITYQQFRAKTDSEQANYTGYVTGWTEGGISADAWTSPVAAIIGATSVTITNSNITTASIIDSYCENVSGTPIGINSCVITTGQIVLSFDALTEATNFRIHITNL